VHSINKVVCLSDLYLTMYNGHMCVYVCVCPTSLEGIHTPSSELLLHKRHIWQHLLQRNFLLWRGIHNFLTLKINVLILQAKISSNVGHDTQSCVFYTRHPALWPSLPHPLNMKFLYIFTMFCPQSVEQAPHSTYVTSISILSSHHNCSAASDN